MKKVKDNEKADFCLEYNGIAACNHRYASKEEQKYEDRGYHQKPIKNDNPLITKYYDGEDGCCILQKKVGFDRYETTVYLSPNGRHLQIRHCYDTGHSFATYHTTKLSISDFKKINKALNKNLKIKKEKQNGNL